jgi:hypothetical protein
MGVAFEFALGQKVMMAINGKTGEVVGLWLDEDGIKQAMVRFADGSGAVNETWFREKHLSAVA